MRTRRLKATSSSVQTSVSNETHFNEVAQNTIRLNLD